MKEQPNGKNTYKHNYTEEDQQSPTEIIERQQDSNLNPFVHYNISSQANKNSSDSKPPTNVNSQEESYDTRGYVALEAKQIVPIDDLQNIKDLNDHSRRIIKPFKGNQWRASSSSENAQRLWFTAGANYDKRVQKNSRESPEFGNFPDFKESPMRRDTGKGNVISFKKTSKVKGKFNENDINIKHESSYGNNW